MKPNWEATPDLLRERVILVTGAASGIGCAAAQSYAAHGATVVLLDKSLSKLEDAYDKIEKAGHPKPAIYALNLETATPGDYEELAATTDRELGRLDGILHNAAMSGALAPIEHYNVQLWYQTLQVNLNAPFLLTRACLPSLRKADDASILFLSDQVGRKGKAYWGAYGVSKSGIEGLVQILADELDPSTNIRVNSIDPGPVRTRLRSAAYPAENPSKWPKPETIMKMFLYLMGPDSAGTTGGQFHAQGSPPSE